MRRAKIRPFNEMYDGVDGKILAGLLNGLKVRFPEDYAKCVQLIREFDEIASGRIPYNQFRNEKERALFSRKVFAHLVDDEQIFATDPGDVAELAIVRLNARLEKYLTYPVVDLELKGRRKGSWTVNWESPSHVGNIVYRIVRLAESGWLERVRECKHCSEWYLANRSNKLFCRTACSKLHWQTGGAGKAARRVYMKLYMRRLRKAQGEDRRRGARHVHL